MVEVMLPEAQALQYSATFERTAGPKVFKKGYSFASNIL